jgi:hypothetical protein
VIWDVISWFEATNGRGVMPERIYEAARKVIPECPCQGTGTLVADAPCRCGRSLTREEATELLGALGCEVHAEGKAA